MTKQVEVVFLGRDRVSAQIEFEGETNDAVILGFTFKASGCLAFLSVLEDFKTKVLALPSAQRRLKGSAEFDQLVPQGADHVSILIRELVLKARDEFVLPYRDEELCHCRAVRTDVVDRAIVGGCHSVQSVARMTSAGTSCGTCKPDTESLIAYRLHTR